MKLVVTEKNLAAKKLAEILAVGKPEADKVYSTPVYKFRRDGEDWIAIGLKGHILGVDFPLQLTHDGGWKAVWEEGDPTPITIPDVLGTPPWPKKKPFTVDGVDLKTWKLASLPFLVWAPIGKTPAEREIIRSLKSLAKKAEEVFIATDFDREGELIGSDASGLVQQVNKTVPIRRARFSAITKEEIERAFSEVTAVDDCLAQAGESRQDIDLVWGAVLTRYLTMAKFAGYGNVRSAGRVQTPTLALVVERELEREAFEPETYWQVKTRFASGDAEFGATHATDRFKAAEEAERVMAAVEGATAGRIVSVERKKRTVAAPTPFNTTELQAAAAREGLSPARTMRIAETLYMNGLVSYPRVDNTVYPKSLDLQQILEALTGVAAYRDYAQRLLGAGALHATRGKKETTDHPPITPTAAADPDKLKPEEFKLYNLIARRFMATLSGPATIEGTKVTVDVNGEPFVARGDVLAHAGFREIYPYGLKKDEQLPTLTDGDQVDFLGAELLEKQTEPPSRYSQGTLLQEMEKRGLGTKATRHAIIERLIQVNYAEELDKGKAIAPTCRGRAVIEVLQTYAPRITTPTMTAELEAEMDDIANGRAERIEVVRHSRQLLGKVIEDLIPQTEAVGEMLKAAAVDDAKVGLCPKSGHDLLVKTSMKTKGQFVGCSGWPDCDVTYPLPQGKIEAVDEACPECGTPQVRVIQFRQKPLTRCLDPECKTNYEAQIDVGECPTCREQGRPGGRLMTQRSKNLKRFVRCTNYEECNTSYPLPQRGEIEPTDEVCEPCGSPKVVIQTSKGPWRICIDPNCPTKADLPKKPVRGRGRSATSRKKS
ncbi:MAG TPA: DNA topoisomerase I [Coriobacteriia bacterium]|nr:DNA topoisomerase I [Coriobacteriia bacterium]